MHSFLVPQFSSDSQRGQQVQKRLRTAGLERLLFGDTEGVLFIFVSQYQCRSALHIVEAPEFVTLINIKMDMSYDGKFLSLVVK